MSSPNFKAPSRISNATGNLSAAELVAGLERWDKENAGPNGIPLQSPPRRTSSRHSFLSNMSTSIGQLLFHSQKQPVAGPKAPLSGPNRLSDGGAMFNSSPSGSLNTPQPKSPQKRSASMAEMDELSSPPKRPRHDDSKVPFVFIENMTLLQEDMVLSRKIFLDLVDAQDERALCDGYNPREIFTMVPSIDPKELFGKGDSSTKTSKPEYSVVPESEGDSIFGTWFSSFLNHEDGKAQRKVKTQSSQKSGDVYLVMRGALPPRGDRPDAGEVAAACETKDNEVLPVVRLPLVGAATDGHPFRASSNQNPPSPMRSPKPRPQTVSMTSPLAKAPLDAVPKPSHLPKAKQRNHDSEKKRNMNPEATQAGSSSSGDTDSSLAAPRPSKAPAPFAYSKAQAQEIWELAQFHKYRGAHALFHESEQFILIEGEKKVQGWLDKHPKARKRLENTTVKSAHGGSSDGTARKELYLCGASAIWKPVGNPKNVAAGDPLGYRLTYKRCEDQVYATIDNYKKHVYRYHLAKVIPQYRQKEGDQKKGDTKGKSKAPQEQKKDRINDEDSEDSGYEDAD